MTNTTGNFTTNTATEIFGLFELDAAGTVMYSRIDPNSSNVSPLTDLIGRNFFDDIAASEEIAELRRRFRFFAKGTDAAEKFTFTYLSEQQPVNVKVLLTQVSQRDYDRQKKMIIVDIRKIQ